MLCYSDSDSVEEFVRDAYAWHPPQREVDLSQVTWAGWFITSYEGYGQVDGVAVGMLPDETWVVVDGGCDTTGWDCQSAAVWTFHPSLEDAQRNGLTNERRSRLNIV